MVVIVESRLDGKPIGAGLASSIDLCHLVCRHHLSLSMGQAMPDELTSLHVSRLLSKICALLLAIIIEAQTA